MDNSEIRPCPEIPPRLVQESLHIVEDIARASTDRELLRFIAESPLMRGSIGSYNRPEDAKLHESCKRLAKSGNLYLKRFEDGRYTWSTEAPSTYEAFKNAIAIHLSGELREPVATIKEYC